MPIRVLLADDSEVMLSAIRKLIEEEPRLELIGEASSFAKTMQMIADFKPEVLVLDLHMAEKRDFGPALVKSQLVSVDHVLAVSFSNDAEAKALAVPTPENARSWLRTLTEEPHPAGSPADYKTAVFVRDKLRELKEIRTFV